MHTKDAHKSTKTGCAAVVSREPSTPVRRRLDKDDEFTTFHVAVVMLGAVMGFLVIQYWPSSGIGIARHTPKGNAGLPSSYDVWSPEHWSDPTLDNAVLRYHTGEPTPDCPSRPLKPGHETQEVMLTMLQHRRPHVVLTLHKLLSWVMSDYDASAVLGVPRLHLLTTSQWRELLQPWLTGQSSSQRGHLLDVGAGNGDLTRPLAELFSGVMTTEVSAWLTGRLRWNGFPSVVTYDPGQEGLATRSFHCISVMHVLDRCRNPAWLLRSLAKLLQTDGLLVVTLPLPYYSHHPKDEGRLLISGSSWDAAAVSAVVQLQLALPDFVVRSVTRTPYLCEGTYLVPIFALDDAVFVLSRRTAQDTTS